MKKNKKYLNFVLVIVLIGLAFGFIYYQFLSENIKESITSTLNDYNSFRYNFIIKDLIIMSLLLVSSFFVIGIPLSIFYLFYESLSIGFLINIFFVSFGIKGLIYSLLYILLNKLITFLLSIIFIYKVINIGRFIIGVFIYKKDEFIKDKIILNFKNSLYIIVFVLIINIILYFISPLIFENLSFLLK